MRFKIQDSRFKVLQSLLLLICVICAICGWGFGQVAAPPAVGFNGGIVGTAETAINSTFTNSTNATLASVTVAITGTNSGDFSVTTTPSTNCGGSLTAAATCTLAVGFTPGAVGGRSAILTVAWTGGSLVVPLYGSGLPQGSSGVETPVGNYQGTTATAITTANYTYLSGPLLVSTGSLNYLNKKLRIHADGNLNLAATSVLNVEVSFCTVSGCGSGTVVTPAGWVWTSASDTNVAATQQFTIDGTFTVSALDTGSGGTGMAKGVGCFNIGANNAAAPTCYADVATAVSAAVIFTVPEYIQVAFKFSSSNASNTATMQDFHAEFIN